VEPILYGVEASILSEGVKFLYQQAGEILFAWRARRRDRDAPIPRVLPAPTSLTVVKARPLPDPSNNEVVDALQELKDLLEPIRAGVIDIDSATAREVIERSREVIEAVLRTPVTFAGESPRPLRVSDVAVVVERVSGRVTGLRADLAKLPRAEVSGVRVQTANVEAEGDVRGVDLT